MIIKYKCQICGKEFEDQDWRKRKYCTKKCSATRPNSGRYEKGNKHSKETEEKRIKGIKENHKGMLGKKHSEKTKKQMRKSSLVPYNYIDGGYKGKISNNKCSVCGIKQKVQNGRSIICLHHIDGNRTNNDIKNLIAVCYKCHAEKHKQMRLKK